MILLREDGTGVTLKIKVKPRSRESAILGVRAGLLLIAVTAVPEQGKANKAVIDLLAGQLRIAKSSFEIISGQTHSEKVIRVREISKEELERALLSVI